MANIQTEGVRLTASRVCALLRSAFFSVVPVYCYVPLDYRGAVFRPVFRFSDGSALAEDERRFFLSRSRAEGYALSNMLRFPSCKVFRVR